MLPPSSNMLPLHCRNASYYKQRIAGKSLPMEKFVIKRCARYQVQGRRLILPTIELLCLWNMFHILAKNDRGIQNVLKVTSRPIKLSSPTLVACYLVPVQHVLISHSVLSTATLSWTSFLIRS